MNKHIELDRTDIRQQGLRKGIGLDGFFEIVLLVVCILALVATAQHLGVYYLPWLDEMMFADPAANLHFGQGFTSSIFPFQRPDEFFFGNAPLFPFLLSIWFDLFGFGIRQARAFVYLTSALSMFGLWVLLRRHAPLLPGWLRVLLSVTAFAGVGTLGNMWNARYDSLGILLVVWIAVAWPHHRRHVVAAAIFLMAALAAVSGYQLVAAFAVSAVVIIYCFRNSALRPLMLIASGIGFGLLAWLFIIFLNGGDLKKFFLVMLGSKFSIIGQVGQLVVQGDSFVLHKFREWRFIATQDPSVWVMAAVLALLLFWARRYSNIREQIAAYRTNALALGMVLLLPLTIYIIGNLYWYYMWMAYLPAVILCAYVASMLRAAGSRSSVALLTFACLLAIIVGGGSWGWKKYSNTGVAGYPLFERAVADSLDQEDLVYAGPRAYFAARQKSSRVFAETYANTALVPGLPERDTITVIVVHRDEYHAASERLGGTWSIVRRLSDDLPIGSELDYVIAKRR